MKYIDVYNCVPGAQVARTRAARVLHAYSPAVRCGELGALSAAIVCKTGVIVVQITGL